MNVSFRPRAGSWKWWICGLLLLASTINYMDRQTLSNAAVQIKAEFQLSNEQYGNLELAFGWAFAVGSLIFGLAADRVSVRFLYPAVLVLWSAVGFATGLVRGYEGLLVCRTFLGLFEAGHWPCALKTTQRLLAPADRAMGNSVLQSGTSIGAVITPLLMNIMMTDQTGSWRMAFQAIGGVGLLWVFVWLGSIRKNELAPLETSSSHPATASSHPEFWRIALSRRFLVLVIIVVLINTSWQLLRAWLPLFLQQGRGYSASEARYFNALYYVATDVGCLGAGALTLWLGRRGLSVHASRRLVFLCCAILTALTAVVAILPKGYLLLATLLLIGMGALGVFPCYYALSQELTTTHQGKVTGLTGVFAWALSAPVHRFFGRLVDQTGSFDLGLAIVGLTPLVAFLALWLLWDQTKSGPAAEGGASS